MWLLYVSVPERNLFVRVCICGGQSHLTVATAAARECASCMWACLNAISVCGCAFVTDSLRGRQLAQRSEHAGPTRREYAGVVHVDLPLFGSLLGFW